MHFILLRMLSFSNIISFGIYPKNRAAILLSTLIVFNLMTLNKFLRMMIFFEKNPFLEIALFVFLLIFFRAYYSLNRNRFNQQILNESKKVKWSNFYIVLLYCLFSFAVFVYSVTI